MAKTKTKPTDADGEMAAVRAYQAACNEYKRAAAHVDQVKKSNEERITEAIMARDDAAVLVMKAHRALLKEIAGDDAFAGFGINNGGDEHVLVHLSKTREWGAR